MQTEVLSPVIEKFVWGIAKISRRLLDFTTAGISDGAQMNTAGDVM